MSNAVRETYFGILLLIVLENLSHARSTLGTLYKLEIEDKILNDTVIKTIRNQNKIHCGTLCCMEDECVGFGINNGSCSLLNRMYNNETCETENCFEAPGMKIYMKVPKRAVITTTAALPTTEENSTVPEENVVDVAVNLTIATDKATSTDMSNTTSADESTTIANEENTTTEKSGTADSTSSKSTSTDTTEQTSTSPTSKQASESTTSQPTSTTSTEESSTNAIEDIKKQPL